MDDLCLISINARVRAEVRVGSTTKALPKHCRNTPKTPPLESGPAARIHPARVAPYSITGIEKSAPSLIPLGQRAVTVLVRV
jgi:hypothetical protein